MAVDSSNYGDLICALRQVLGLDPCYEVFVVGYGRRSHTAKSEEERAGQVAIYELTTLAVKQWSHKATYEVIRS